MPNLRFWTLADKATASLNRMKGRRDFRLGKKGLREERGQGGGGWAPYLKAAKRLLDKGMADGFGTTKKKEMSTARRVIWVWLGKEAWGEGKYSCGR